MHVSVYVCVHICKYVLLLDDRRFSMREKDKVSSTSTRFYVCVRVCFCVCMCVHNVCMYRCMTECVCVCMYICMYVGTSVCIYAYVCIYVRNIVFLDDHPICTNLTRSLSSFANLYVCV